MRKLMVTVLTTSSVGSVWAGQFVYVTAIVCSTVLLLGVLLFVAWRCVLRDGRDVSDLTEVLQIVFGRGRDPDPEHPPDQHPGP